MRKTLVFMCRTLEMGGIEALGYQIMDNALNRGNRVVWISSKHISISPAFASLFEDNRVEIVPLDYSRLRFYKLPKINFAKDEEVTILVHSLFFAFYAFNLKQHFKDVKIRVLYITPHFTGDSIFPERAFGKHLKSLIRKLCASIYKKMYDGGNLMFYAKSHVEALEKEYGIKLCNSDYKLSPSFSPITPFDTEYVRQVYRKYTFTIVSPGRFEFPHKGYLLGLIKTFAELQPLNPHLRLLIIGSGVDQKKLESLISSLDENVRNSIELRTPVSEKELETIVRQCNLSICVAGCASLCARNGVPTLPARHYVTDCEVYGFFPESKSKTTCTDPGLPVKPFIEDVLSMNEDEYVELCRRAYLSFDDNVDLEFPLNVEISDKYLPSCREYTLVSLMYLVQRFKMLSKRFSK